MLIGGGDNWHIIKNMYRNTALDTSQQLNEPFPHPKMVTLTADGALEQVLKNAGAVLPRRDPVDRKVINDVKESKGGIINSKSHPFEWPPFATEATSPTDTDNDGMPDFWEEEYNLNARDSTNHNDDPDEDGYLNIEEYINGTNPISNIVTLSASSSRRIQPEDEVFSIPYALLQNVPNPFTDSTKITFSIEAPAHTTLSLVGQDGVVVKNIIDGFLYEGKYEFYLDGRSIKGGVYALHLVSGSYNESVKVIYTK